MTCTPRAACLPRKWQVLPVAALLAWTTVATARADEKTDAIAHARGLSRAFRLAAEATLPTVVEVETRVKAKPVRGNRGENPFKGTPFEQFFDNEQGFGGEGPREGLGSGVIIDPSGLVLTNNHVVDGADEVTIRLADGREFKTTEVKTDPQTDLAVLRIHGAENLPYAKLGDSDLLEIGDWVIAVGNPFGQEQTVTAGIISGKGRQLREASRTSFLQTDAAINPGNSGGPLVNLEGEVIGINTAIATNSGGYQGVGFAVPINLAKWITRQLIDKGSVQRAYLGVQIRPVTAELAEVFRVDQRAGALVTEVYPGTPAADAGFQAGDLIVEYAGAKVAKPADLQSRVERTPPGEKQPVVVVRDGKRITLEVLVKPLPEDFAAAGQKPTDEPQADGEANEPASYRSDAFGFQVSELNGEQSEALGFTNHRGVLVTKVDADGLAAECGLQRGMLVIGVGRNRAAVESVGKFQELLEAGSPDDGIVLLVRFPRGGQDFVILKKSAN